MVELLLKDLTHLGLITAFALIALIMWLSTKLSKYLTNGRVHASAIAIVIGLILAWFGGKMTGGEKGLTDLALFTGVGLMGGAMLRDFTIVATAFEVQATEDQKSWIYWCLLFISRDHFAIYCRLYVCVDFWLSRCGKYYHNWRRCSDLHCWASYGCGHWCEF